MIVFCTSCTSTLISLDYGPRFNGALIKYAFSVYVRCRVMVYVIAKLIQLFDNEIINEDLRYYFKLGLEFVPPIIKITYLFLFKSKQFSEAKIYSR